jgi:L-fuculose-phosphate aldolase
MSDSKERQLMVQIGRFLYERGFLAGYEGNFSIRTAPGRILITPAGLHKGLLCPEHLLVVDEEGERIDLPTAANRDLRPSSELPMHLEAYRQRPDISAIVHAHPPHAIALSIAGLPIADALIPEVEVLLGRIPVTPYATPSSPENAAAIRHVIRDHDALVLERHGALTVGADLMEAFMRMETVESAARIAFLVARLGASDHLLTADQRAVLHARRQASAKMQP